VHDSLVYGYFGMALNLTDGRYTYFRNPVQADTTVNAYTAMPTGFHGFLPREQLASAELGRFLGHTYNIPIYKIPQKGQAPHRHGASADSYQPVHELFDLSADPGQDHPLDDAALIARFNNRVRAHLYRLKAPEEHLARLGL
jgi:hypothetical protein